MNKKVVITFVAFFVLLLTIGMFVFFSRNSNSESPCKKIDENGYCILKDVPEYLKFQEPVLIDEHELYNFSKSPFSDYLVRKDPTNVSKGFLCVETNEPPKLIYYFSKDYNETSKKYDQYRLAVICDTFYVVEDYNPSAYGYTMYGPYEL